MHSIDPRFYPLTQAPESPSSSPLEPPKPLPQGEWRGIAPLPSHIVSRSQIIRKLWACAQFVIKLFLWIAGFRLVSFAIEQITQRLSRKFELALYEDIVLSSSHRHLLGADTSVLLGYMLDFFKRDGETPPHLLKQLSQAHQWSQKLDAAQSAWTFGRRQARLGSLSQEIGAVIRNLKEGEAALIPGGVAGSNPRNAFGLQTFAFYRVTKTGESYSLEVHSRDGSITGSASLFKEGKEKLLSSVRFTGIESQEIHDPLLWRALLSIQLPKAYDDERAIDISQFIMGFIFSRLGRPAEVLKNLMNGQLNAQSRPLEEVNWEATESPLPKLLEPFADRLDTALPDGPRGYHAERGLHRVQTLWSLIHDEREEAFGKLTRRKLRLQLETLFHYFANVQEGLSGSPLHRAYLQEGMKALAESVIAMREKQELSSEDVASIAVEFQAIADAIAKAEKKEPEDMNLSWFHTLSKVVIREEALRPMSSGPAQPGEIPVLESEPRRLKAASERSAIPFSKGGAPVDLAAINRRIQGMGPRFASPDTLCVDLRAAVSRCKAADLTPSELQHALMEIVWTLPPWVRNPYELSSEERADLETADNSSAVFREICDQPNRSEIPNNAWKTLSPETRLEILRDLTEISEMIAQSANEAGSFLPDRLIALIRIGNLSEYIARLDEARSYLTAAFFIFFFSFSIRLRWSPSLRWRSRGREGVFDEDSFHWHWVRKREQIWEKANRNKFPASYKKAPASIYQTLLYRQWACLDHFKRESEQGSEWGLNSSDFFQRISSWGLPVEHPLVKVAASSFHLGEKVTQEEIVDNPEKALKRIYFEEFLSEFSAYVSRERAEQLRRMPLPRLPISREDLQEFLLALEDKTAIWTILGIIEKSPDVLAHPGCRAVLEIYFTDQRKLEAITRNLGPDSDLPQFLETFFPKQIERYWQRGQESEALFLVRLAHTLHFNDPARFPRLNFRVFVKSRLEESLTQAPQFTDQTHSLITEYLHVLQHQKTLLQTEARDYLLYGFLFEYLRPNLDSFDPVIDDAIRIDLRRSAPLIADEIRGELPALLDAICHLTSVPLTRDLWIQRSRLCFQSGAIEIDLIHGSVDDFRAGCSLPPVVLRSLHFRRLFSSVSKRGKLQAKPVAFNGGMAYAFFDAKGIEWRIETKNEQVTIYKKEKEVWLQYLAPDDFLFPKELSTPLPRYIQDQYLFANLKDPDVLHVYDADQKPLFKIKLKASRKWIGQKRNSAKAASQVDDLRSGGEARLCMQIAPLSYLEPIALHPFLGFEEGSQIIVWSKQGKIQEIELPRHRLRFRIDGKTVVCSSPPFENYRLEPEGKETRGVSGLPVALVLSAPKGSSLPDKLLVPHFRGGYFDLLPSPLLNTLSNPGYVAKKLLSKILPASSHAPKYNWLFSGLPGGNENNTSAIEGGYWTFDLPRYGGNDSALGTPQASAPVCVDAEERIPEALLDLLEYALHQTAVDSGAAIFLGKRVLDSLQTLPKELFSTELLQKRGRRIAEFAVMGNPLITPGGYPDTAALALRIFLLLKTKIPPHMQTLCDEWITAAAGAYFSQGKHSSRNVRLSKELREEVLESVKRINPAQCAVYSSAPFKAAIRKPFFHKEPPKFSPERLRELHDCLCRPPSKKVPPFESLFFSQDKEKLLHAFPRIYSVLKGPADSLAFGKLRFTFKAAAPSDFTSYMEMLFDLKKRQPHLILPELPSLSDLELLPGSERFEAAKESFTTFFSRLSEPLLAGGQAGHPPLEAQPLLAPIPVPVSLEEEKENTQWEIREAAVRKNDQSPIPLSLPERPSSRLGKNHPAAAFFSDIPAPPHLLPDFQQMFRDPEPCVARLAKGLSEELQGYKKPTIKFIQNSEAIEAYLEGEIAAQSAAAQQQKEHIDRMLGHSHSLFNKAEILAGAEPIVTWSDLKTAFLQKDLAVVVRQLRGVLEEGLKSALIAYFEAETLRKQAVFTQKEFLAAREENLLNSPATAEKLYKLLIRDRGYSVQSFPQLLVVEEMLGFLMEESQLEMVRTVLRDPHAVCQAVTGAGKTSVIMVLLGLLKANGTNLVTLKFLDPLFAENARHLQKVLGQTMKKKIAPLLFSTKTPIAIASASGPQVSLFKSMYEELLQVVLEKGCVITNRRSLPLLEAKFISILHRVSNRPVESGSIDGEHLFYLSKILRLMREREECIYDEHDKALYPRDEIHLALGGSDHPPPFAIETVLDVLQACVMHPRLGLRANTQAERSSAEREAILAEIAGRVAEDWQQRGVVGCGDYFLGRSDAALNSCTDPDRRDRLALTKDLFLTYLPVTLSQTANRKYILSEDGESVIPCEYTDIPREGCHFDNFVERLVYTVQYYYQNGVSSLYLRKWYEELRRSALAQMEKEKLASVAETDAQRTFQDYFPHRDLPIAASDEMISSWGAEIANNIPLISRFLRRILPRIEIQKQKISMDAQNVVSMSNASGGVSATKGCKEGLHPQFTQPVSPSAGYDTAQMIHSLMQKIGDNRLIRYPASEPEQVIGSLFGQKPDMGVLVDGAGALLGILPQAAAQQIFRSTNKELSNIDYFDRGGRLQMLHPEASGDLKHKGQFYPHHAARGADARLSPSIPAVLLANGRDSLEVVLQNAGRLRHPNHPLTFAVPKESSIDSITELLCSSLSVQAKENSDNLYRSELQKIRDAVRTQMLDRLIKYCSERGLQAAIQLCLQFEEAGDFLITEKLEDWSQPGAYFAAHGKIQRKNLRPVEFLRQKKEEYLKLCSFFELKSQWLEKYDPESLAASMPLAVWDNVRLAMGQQAQVEIEVELEAQKETQTEMQAIADIEEDPAFYLPWNSHNDVRFRIHSFSKLGNVPAAIYDPSLCFTENYLPLNRRGWAPRIHHRTAHDRRQNRLHYVTVDYGKFNINNNPVQVTALDILDLREIAFNSSSDTFLIYDVKLGRFISKKSWRSKEEAIRVPHQFDRLIAQLKFEDGQFQSSDYSQSEWAALCQWLEEHRGQIASIRDYVFSDVLRNRPADQERFRHSSLNHLFNQLQTS